MNRKNGTHFYTTPTSIARQQREEEAAARRFAIASAALKRYHNYKEDWRHERAYQVRKLYEARRNRLAMDLIAGLGIAVMLVAAVSLLFIFIWGGFDPALTF